jgi:hypothetical protein
MKTVILLVFSLFLLNGSIQGQRDTINFVDSPITPLRKGYRTNHSLNDFKNLTVSLTNTEIFKIFGEPAKDIGSGLFIFVYVLDDSTEVWIGSNGKKIFYAKHMDANHHLIETLDLQPDPDKINH